MNIYSLSFSLHISVIYELMLQIKLRAYTFNRMNCTNEKEDV